MRQVSEDLGRFQINLSQGDLAPVTPKIATEVFSSICYLEDLSATGLARKTGVEPKTMCDYCRKTGSTTPNFNKFVHLMASLGYDVYLKKRQ